MKLIRLVLLLCAGLLLAVPARAASVLQAYLPAVTASDLVPGAEGFGPIRDDIAVAPVLKDGKTVAFVVVTSDFVGTTGYSGKPIHTLVAVGTDAKILGVKLVKHSEPIVLIGIPEAKVKALVASYAGLDLVAEEGGDRGVMGAAERDDRENKRGQQAVERRDGELARR